MMWALCWRSSYFMKGTTWSQRKLHTYCFMFPFLLATSVHLLLIDVIHPHGRGLAWISPPLMFASSSWVPWHADTSKQEGGLRTACQLSLHTNPCMIPPVLQVSNLEAKSWSWSLKVWFSLHKAVLILWEGTLRSRRAGWCVWRMWHFLLHLLFLRNQKQSSNAQLLLIYHQS